MTDARLRQLYREAIDGRDAGERATCPSPEALQDLVERRGAEAERLATLDHVLACIACARELELLRALRAASRTGARWHIGSWARAAAIAIVILGGAATLRAVRHTPAVMRGAGGHTVHLIAANGAPVLRWHAVPNAISYHVEVLDPQGTTITSAATTDTAFTLPADTRSVISPNDLWWVRARLHDGTEVRSETEPLGASH